MCCCVRQRPQRFLLQARQQACTMSESFVHHLGRVSMSSQIERCPWCKLCFPFLFFSFFLKIDICFYLFINIFSIHHQKIIQGYNCKNKEYDFKSKKKKIIKIEMESHLKSRLYGSHAFPKIIIKKHWRIKSICMYCLVFYYFIH